MKHKYIYAINHGVISSSQVVLCQETGLVPWLVVYCPMYYLHYFSYLLCLLYFLKFKQIINVQRGFYFRGVNN